MGIWVENYNWVIFYLNQPQLQHNGVISFSKYVDLRH